jgi:hypothetical protein
MASKKKKNISPQAKGWQTRRRNAAKRTIAAKNGWKTRRTNLTKKKILRKKRKEEYVLRFSYTLAKNKKRGQLEMQVRVEIHVTGPARSKREVIIRAARSVFGVRVAGFDAEIIAWEKEYLSSGRIETFRNSKTFNNALVRTTVGTGNAEFRDRSDTKL